MELKLDALEGLPKGDNPKEVEKFDHRVNKWYSGFCKRPNFSIRYCTSVGEKLPKGFEGKAWVTLMKIRAANVKRAAAFHAKRTAATARQGYLGPAAAFAVDDARLSPEQLLSMQEEVLRELSNMAHTPIQQKIPVDTTL